MEQHSRAFQEDTDSTHPYGESLQSGTSGVMELAPTGNLLNWPKTSVLE